MVPPGQLDQHTQADPPACQWPSPQFLQVPSAPSEPALLCRDRAVSRHGQFSGHDNVSEAAASALATEALVQGQPSARCASPPPPAYPPGFEPKQDLTGCHTTHGAARNNVVPNADMPVGLCSQPQPQLQSHNACLWPEPQPPPQPHVLSRSHPHIQAHLHPHMHPNLHGLPETRPYFELQHQHQGRQMQSPYPPQGLQQHHASQMIYSAGQNSCQASVAHPGPHFTNMPMFQSFDESGTVLGVPMMGAPHYLDGKVPGLPPEIPHYQQSVQKSRKSIYHLTKYFQKRVPNHHQPDGERLQWCDRQPPIRQNSCAEFGRKHKWTGSFIPSARRQTPPFLKAEQKRLAYSYRNGHENQYIPNSNAGSAKDLRPAAYNYEQMDEGKTNLSSWESLQCNMHERISAELPCSESKLDSVMKVQQERFSIKAPGERLESKMMFPDSKAVTLPFTKHKTGVTRWLEQRKYKCPTPPNMQWKAQERRKQEEIGASMKKKPRNYLQERFVEENQLGNSDSDSRTFSHADAPDHFGNDPELPMEIEDSGPIESPCQGQASEFEKGLQEENLQYAPENAEMNKEVDKENVRTPCLAFVFRCKRREQKRGNSALAVRRQKRLLSMLLNRGVEKENSYLLQSCRYFVNDHFLQGFHTGPKQLSSAENFSTVEAPLSMGMDTTELVTMASADKSKTDLDRDCCLGSSSNLADNEDLCVSQQAPFLPLLSAEDEPSSDKPKELIEVAQEPMMPAEKFLVQERSPSEIGPAQGTASSDNYENQSEERHKLTITEEIPTSEYVKQESLSKFDSRVCLENKVSERHSESFATSHGQVVATSGFAGTAGVSVLADPSCNQYEKQALFTWKHSESRSLQTSEDDLASEHHVSMEKAQLMSSNVVAVEKQLAMLSSNSVLDTQVIVSSVWDQQHFGSHIPGHSVIDTDDLGTGYGDSFLGDEDDVLQYMNFDAFDTDSGMCYG